MDVSVLRKIVKSSRNPPPFVRPSSRSMLFDLDALHEWQKTWKTNTGERLDEIEKTRNLDIAGLPKERCAMNERVNRTPIYASLSMSM